MAVSPKRRTRSGRGEASKPAAKQKSSLSVQVGREDSLQQKLHCWPVECGGVVSAGPRPSGPHRALLCWREGGRVAGGWPQLRTWPRLFTVPHLWKELCCLFWMDSVFLCVLNQNRGAKLVSKLHSYLHSNSSSLSCIKFGNNVWHCVWLDWDAGGRRDLFTLPILDRTRF